MISWLLNGIASQFRKPRGLLGHFASKGMLKLNRVPYEWILSELPIGADHEVLEIGFGPGYGIRRVAEIVASGRGSVTGLDFSPSMCKRAAKANFRMVEAHKAKLELGDAAKMPFADGSFDFAFAVNVLYFWKDLGHCLEEIRRVLRPGGMIALYFTDAASLKAEPMTRTGVFQFYEREEIVAALESAGFSNVKAASREIEEVRARLGHLALARA